MEETELLVPDYDRKILLFLYYKKFNVKHRLPEFIFLN